MKNDNVNHPAHYNHDGIETIDVIKAWTKDLKPFEAYCMGNVIKYVSRWKDKNGIEDLKKARWYMNRVIGEENAEQTNQEKASEDKKEDEWWKQFFVGTCRDYVNGLEDSHYIRGLDDCIPKEQTLDKSTASKAFGKGELSIVFTADDNAAIADKMLDCIKYLDTNGYRREHLIIELLGYLVNHPTAWKNKWSIVISLAGCRPDGKWIDIYVAQDGFRSHPTINDKPYYIWPSEED